MEHAASIFVEVQVGAHGGPRQRVGTPRASKLAGSGGVNQARSRTDDQDIGRENGAVELKVRSTSVAMEISHQFEAGAGARRPP